MIKYLSVFIILGGKMKKQPIKYRLNVIGGALIIFLLIRTYVPMIGLQAGLNKNFDLWLIFYMLTLALSCLLPIMFIERMCDFHPQVIKRPAFKMEHGRLVMTCMMMFIGFSVIGSIALTPLEKLGISFPASRLLPIDNTFTLVLYFVFTSVIPAIFEELLVRGEPSFALWQKICRHCQRADFYDDAHPGTKLYTGVWCRGPAGLRIPVHRQYICQHVTALCKQCLFFCDDVYAAEGKRHICGFICGLCHCSYNSAGYNFSFLSEKKKNRFSAAFVGRTRPVQFKTTDQKPGAGGGAAVLFYGHYGTVVP